VLVWGGLGLVLGVSLGGWGTDDLLFMLGSVSVDVYEMDSCGI
jgi:hypothetical protein